MMYFLMFLGLALFSWAVIQAVPHIAIPLIVLAFLGFVWTVAVLND